jgi:hypothetical protein
MKHFNRIVGGVGIERSCRWVLGPALPDPLGSVGGSRYPQGALEQRGDRRRVGRENQRAHLGYLDVR